jgi:hypothetical protein
MTDLSSYLKMAKKNVLLPFHFFVNSHLYDLIHQIDTSKRVYSHQFKIKNQSNFNFSEMYSASYTSIIKKSFRKIYEFLDYDLSNCIFIDIGSGKGKVVHVWARYMVSKNLDFSIIGIEFNNEFVSIAKENLIKSDLFSKKITLYCGDVLDFDFQELKFNKLVIFMYNPFSQLIFDKFMKKTQHLKFILVILNNNYDLSQYRNLRVLVSKSSFHPNLSYDIFEKG